jgi:hypothetical protein
MSESETEIMKFHVEDLKIKHSSSEGHAARMWARFNYFLAIHAGLFFLLFKKDDPMTQPEIADLILIGTAGIIMSILWYIMGAQDLYHMATLRRQREQSYDYIHKKMYITRCLCYPVQTEDLSIREDMGLLQWRIGPISLSKFPSFFPLMILVTWVVILVKLHLLQRLFT